MRMRPGALNAPSCRGAGISGQPVDRVKVAYVVAKPGIVQCGQVQDKLALRAEDAQGTDNMKYSVFHKRSVDLTASIFLT
jgi:hypothetical protein